MLSVNINVPAKVCNYQQDLTAAQPVSIIWTHRRENLKPYEYTNNKLDLTEIVQSI